MRIDTVDFPCPVCGGREASVFLDGSDATLEASEFGSSRKTARHGRILRCRNCRFGFSQFRPSDEELSSLYRQMDNEVYDQELPGRTTTARRHLRLLQRFVPPVSCWTWVALRGC